MTEHDPRYGPPVPDGVYALTLVCDHCPGTPTWTRSAVVGHGGMVHVIEPNDRKCPRCLRDGRALS